ncbi:MAG: YdcF family protein [Alphaproteobacteria bacterium]
MAPWRRSRFARGSRGLRLALAIATIAGLAWVGGLVWFVGQVPREPTTVESPIEAIVVLTGGSGRLEEGLALLRANPGARLFVSGVYHGVDVAELLRLDREIPDALRCCVELGHAADDTRGNARESAAWVKALSIRTIRLVTGNYHMPRSLLEFRRAMPDVTIQPHPIIVENVRLEGWWYQPGTAVLLASEYLKYLAAYVAVTGP